jgi:hypothetical protein
VEAMLKDSGRPSSSMPGGVADDILEGTDAIAAFLGITHRRAKYLIERRLIPYGKLGGRCLASRERLTEHLRGIAAGETAR